MESAARPTSGGLHGQVDRRDSATRRAVSQRVRNAGNNLARRAKGKVKAAIPFERKRTIEAPISHVWAPDIVIDVLEAQLAGMPCRGTSAASVIEHHMTVLHGLLTLARPVGADGEHGSAHTPMCGCDLS